MENCKNIDALLKELSPKERLDFITKLLPYTLPKVQAITLYEFNLLDDERQYELIFIEGNFLDYKLQGKKRFVLYALFRFFVVEIEYSVPDNAIINKRTFVAGKLLDKYASLD